MTRPSSDRFFAALRRTPFAGDIQSDWSSRIVWSTDNSIFQWIPDGILFPKTTDDVVIVMTMLSDPMWDHLCISPRGGGTGTNGQSLNHGIILDTSRYMTKILELNSDQRWVRVQPGVVLDQLNTELRSTGLLFGPNVAPSNRATIGGMISTDASGKGSRRYGKTSQQLISVKAITLGGTLTEFGIGIPSPIDDILAEIGTHHRDEIDRRFPKMPRFLSGYNFDHATRDGINTLPIIAGSEGTLAIIVEATLSLAHPPQSPTLIVMHHHTLSEAIQSAQEWATFNPIAIETMDHTIIQLGISDTVSEPIREWIHKDAGALTLIEVESDNPLLGHIRSTSTAGAPEWVRIVTHSKEAAQWWQLRKKAVGLLANRPGKAQPVAFIEDTAVPPECMASYITELKQLLDAHQLDYAMYGHADAGCIHVRPALDLQDPIHEGLVNILTDEVFKLVTRYSGVLWGEHGKGFRTAHIADVYGPILTQKMQEIKTRFDPNHQLNPGKMVPPLHLHAAISPPPLRAHRDRDIPQEIQDRNAPIMKCNGNGACFSTIPTDLMCPSYMATRDRIQSPKGRAMVFKEWLRLGKPKALGREVFAAFDGCLACKACTSHCPVHVNIPRVKSEFLSEYYRAHGRKLRDYLIAFVEPLSFLASRHALFRWASRLTIFQRAFSLVDLPKHAPEKKELLKRLVTSESRQSDQTVVIVADAFTWCHAPNVLDAAIKIIEHIGYSAQILRIRSTGKPAYNLGFKRLFNWQAKQFSNQLNAVQNVPTVIIEPSISSMFGDELPDHPAHPSVVPIAQFLCTHSDRFQDLSDKLPDKITLLPHCMERSGTRATPAHWVRLFEAIGVSLEIASVGCCGMAGTFGHEKEHVAISKKVYSLSWEPIVATGSAIIVTGDSCRHQVERMTTATPLHPLELIANAL